MPYEMKMYTPISVRESLEQCHDLSNMLSVLLVPLPTRIEDPVTRLRHIGTDGAEPAAEGGREGLTYRPAGVASSCCWCRWWWCPSESVMNRKKRSIVPWGLARIMGAMGTMPRALLSRQMAYLYNKVGGTAASQPLDTPRQHS